MANTNNIAFTIYDRKAEIYNQPFYAPTAGAAVRMIEDTMRQSPDGDLAQHPEDFVLYEVGAFNATTGELITHVHIHIIDVNTLKK